MKVECYVLKLKTKKKDGRVDVWIINASASPASIDYAYMFNFLPF